MTGVVFVRHAGSWRCLNFNSQKIWVKDAGTWKEAQGVWVKDAGSWKKVFPSTTETWTALNLASNVRLSNTGVSPVLIDSINNATAGTPMSWDDGASAYPSNGEYINLYTWGWSPVTEAGIGYGAISRLNTSLVAKYVRDFGHPATTNHEMRVEWNNSDEFFTAALTTSNVTFSFDYTTSAWSLTDAQIGRFHTTSSLNDSLKVYAHQDIYGYITVDDIKARIKCWSN